MGKPSAPKPPDPNATASAQTATNIGTAIANTAMGQVNQVTPDGSLTYNRTGTFNWADPISGRNYALPQYTATTTLSPEAEAINAENKRAQLGLSRTAADQSEFLNQYLGEPAKFDTAAIEGRLDELARGRLDPRMNREAEALRTSLVNRGIGEGSEIWNREMDRFGQYRNDAYNNLMLQGRGQAFSELAAQRNQPINEITALLSGSQVNTPNFAQATPDKAATTDYAGLVNQDFQNRMGLYNQKMENWNQTVGGAMQAIGTVAMGAMMFSDRKMKKDIKPIGKASVEVPLYSFKYKGSDKEQVGVMADEMPPQMVHKDSKGRKMVDYSNVKPLRGLG